jgi:hypothetical protein
MIGIVYKPLNKAGFRKQIQCVLSLESFKVVKNRLLGNDSKSFSSNKSEEDEESSDEESDE